MKRHVVAKGCQRRPLQPRQCQMWKNAHPFFVPFPLDVLLAVHQDFDRDLAPGDLDTDQRPVLPPVCQVAVPSRRVLLAAIPVGDGGQRTQIADRIRKADLEAARLPLNREDDHDAVAPAVSGELDLQFVAPVKDCREHQAVQSPGSTRVRCPRVSRCRHGVPRQVGRGQKIDPIVIWPADLDRHAPRIGRFLSG